MPQTIDREKKLTEKMSEDDHYQLYHLQNVLYKVRHPHCLLQLYPSGTAGMVTLELQVPVRDAHTKKPVTVCLGRGIALHVTDDELVRQAYSVFREFKLHELDENFVYDGIQIFDPHASVDELKRTSSAILKQEESVSPDEEDWRENDLVRLQEVLNKIYYPTAVFNLFPLLNIDMLILRMTALVEDVQTKTAGTFHSTLGISATCTGDDLIRQVHSMIRDFLLHELDENFTYEGVRLFDPHLSLIKLAEHKKEFKTEGQVHDCI